MKNRRTTPYAHQGRGPASMPAAELLVQTRERAGLTQDALASQAGVSKKTIQRAEAGQRCQVNVLSRLARVLGVELTSLLPDQPEERLELPSVREWQPSRAEPLGDWQMLPNGLRVRTYCLESNVINGRRARAKHYEYRNLSDGDGDFLHEVLRRHTQICDQLHSEHLVRSYSCEPNLQQRTCWVIDEWFGGDPLNVLQTRGLKVRDIALISSQILQGLRALHRAGIICRGLTPSSVLVRQTDLLTVITDFELAKFLGSRPTVTPRNGFTMNRFLAPEVQQRGREIEPAADLYSWALITAHMILGPDVSAQAVKVDDLHRLGVPIGSAALIAQALSLHWRKRPTCVDEVLPMVNLWIKTLEMESGE